MVHDSWNLPQKSAYVTPVIVCETSDEDAIADEKAETPSQESPVIWFARCDYDGARCEYVFTKLRPLQKASTYG